jgi:hypothetical protein
MMLSQQFGYPAAPRLPLLMSDDGGTQITENVHLKNIMELEKTLKQRIKRGKLLARWPRITVCASLD